MLEKQFEAMFCLVPTVDTSSNYQNGMPRDTARIMAALIVQEKIDMLASDSDEEVALMLREAIEQIKREATKARKHVKSTPANGLNTRNSVKTQENTVTVTCLAFFVGCIEEHVLITFQACRSTFSESKKSWLALCT